MIKKYFALSLITASMLVAAGCSSDDDEPAPPGVPAADPTDDSSAYDIIVNSESHTTLEAAIVAAGLADTLDDPDNEFTIFAPDDDAFQALDDAEAGTVAGLLADIPALTRILQYHVVSGTYTGDAIATGIASAAGGADYTLESLLQGEGEDGTLTFTDPGTGAVVNGSTAIGTSTEPAGTVSSGALFMIDTVLTPPAVVVEPPAPTGSVLETMQNGGFGKALAALAGVESKLDEAAPENTADNPWTIFAPTDAALGTADITLGEMVFVGPDKMTPELLQSAGSVTMFDDTKVYAIGGTNGAADLTIGGAAATVIGGGYNLTYQLDAAPAAN